MNVQSPARAWMARIGAASGSQEVPEPVRSIGIPSGLATSMGRFADVSASVS
jgi:hypothetical protein